MASDAFLRRGAASPATSHQRLAIRCELRNQDYPTDRVTVMHRDLFQTAGVPWNEGKDLDGELCAMNREQASRLLRQLKGCA
jgi:hypothetical protein